MDCPRCHLPLTTGNLASAQVEGCSECGGMLLARDRLPVLLQEIGPPPSAERLSEPPRRVPDAGGGLRCPRCAGPMENDGYMGSPFVMIDRCSRCDVLWIDDGEIEAMAHQYARVRARSDESDKHRKEMAEQSILHWRFNPWRDSGP